MADADAGADPPDAQGCGLPGSQGSRPREPPGGGRGSEDEVAIVRARSLDESQLGMGAARAAERRPSSATQEGRRRGGGRRRRRQSESAPARGAWTGKAELVVGGRKLGTFDGQWQDGVPHGRGVLVDARGNVFEGEFAHGCKEHGETRFANGDYHSGGYVHNRRHGPGVYVFRDGNRYEGSFAQGRMTGAGRFRWRSGDLYKGAFADGLPHGTGTKRMRNGDTYSGEWAHGQASGWGVKTFALGDRHEGFYSANKRHGFGTYTWLDGSCFEGFYERGKARGPGRKVSRLVELEGTFRDDLLEGYGQARYLAADVVYVGCFHQGRRHGRGTLTWSDQSSATALFENNEMVRGVKFHTSGNIYDGEWRRGMAHGLGMKRFANGDLYVGHFARDQRCGQGMYAWGDDHPAVFRGAWRDGCEHGPGTITYPNAHLFRGTFHHGQKHGNAVMYAVKGGAVVRLRQQWQHGALASEHVLTQTNFHIFDPPPSVRSEQDYVAYFLKAKTEADVGAENPAGIEDVPQPDNTVLGRRAKERSAESNLLEPPGERGGSDRAFVHK